MIIKNSDPGVAADPREAAGQQAEQEMAFYLRRAFKDNEDLLVFNNLRFQFGEYVAQIDHLILHRYGVVLIESKSVTSKVEVNKHSEWVRWWNGRPQGMASPVQQVRRQAEFLKRYLNAHADVLLGKMLGLQKRFGSMEVDVLIAISDRGIISRPRKGKTILEMSEVLKADQVVDRVREIWERHRRVNHPATLFLHPLSKEGGYSWTADEMTRLRAFLLDRHKPVGRPDPGSGHKKPKTNAGGSSASQAGLEEGQPVKDDNTASLVSELAEAAHPLAASPVQEGLRQEVWAVCGTVVSDKVAQYCRDHETRFGGRILCFSHQRSNRK